MPEERGLYGLLGTIPAQPYGLLSDLGARYGYNPAHPPEWWNRGVRNVAGGLLGGLADMVTFPRRYMDNYQPGQSVRDNPAAADWAAGVAMNMVGLPAFTGGVPAGAALGSSMKGNTPRGASIASPAISVNGQIFTGINHAEAVERAASALRTSPETLLGGHIVHRTKIDLEGFLTSDGRYVNRADAAAIANRRGQSASGSHELIAEDLSPDAEFAASQTRALMRR